MGSRSPTKSRALSNLIIIVFSFVLSATIPFVFLVLELLGLPYLSAATCHIQRVLSCNRYDVLVTPHGNRTPFEDTALDGGDTVCTRFEKQQNVSCYYGFSCPSNHGIVTNFSAPGNAAARGERNETRRGTNGCESVVQFHSRKRQFSAIVVAFCATYVVVCVIVFGGLAVKTVSF